MSASVDAFGQSGSTFSSSGHTFTISGGTPSGVVIFVHQAQDQTPETIAVAVDNGGTPVNVPYISGFPVGASTFDAVGGAAYHAYFLGSGVPSGTLTVEITSKSGSNVCFASGYTIDTASGAPEVNNTDVGIDSNSVADPSAVLTLGGVESLVLMPFTSGQADVGDVSPRTGWTSDGTFDPGAITWHTHRYDTVGTADVTYGWTQTVDNAFGMAVAINEAAGGGNVDVDVGTAALTLTTQAATISNDINVAAGTASLTLTPQAATVSLDVDVAVGTAELTLTPNAASVAYDVNVNVGTAALTLTTFNPTVEVGGDVEVAVATAALSLQIFPATVSYDVTVDVGTANLSLTTQAATVSHDVTVSVGTAPLSLTTFPASVAAPTLVNVGTAELALTTYPATVAVASAASGGHFMPGLAGIRAGKRREPREAFQEAAEITERVIDEVLPPVEEKPVQRVSRKQKAAIIEQAAEAFREQQVFIGELHALDRAADLISKIALKRRREALRRSQQAQKEAARPVEVIEQVEDEEELFVLLLMVANL